MSPHSPNARAQRLRASYHLPGVLPAVSLLGAALGKEVPGRRKERVWPYEQETPAPVQEVL